MKPVRLAAVLLAFSAVLAAQVDVTITAAPGTVQLAPGLTGSGWLYNGTLPGPVIRVTEGQVLRARFINNLPEESTIHWHGVPLPLGMDGVPGITRPAVQPGQEFTYEFVAQPAGTYFFHPHVGLQLDRGLYGVLIVDPVTPPSPPPSREYVIVLDDWLAGAPIAGQEPSYQTWLINGKTSAGQAPLQVSQGETVRLRFVNASAGTHYVVALDGHPMTVTHTDGQPVVPLAVQALPIGAGERYDVLVTADNPGTWSLAAADLTNRSVTRVRAIVNYAGSTQPVPSPAFVPPWLATGTLLSYAQLAALGPVQPISPAPSRTYPINLQGGMMNYVWTINGQAFPNVTPLQVQTGESVRLNMSNFTTHRHPMHIHGHFFRLLGTSGGTAAPVVKDTVLVPPGTMMGGGSPVAVEFLADNPGNWAFHCHQLYHAEAGMMTLVQYVNGDQDQDGLANALDLDPLSAYPVLTADGLSGGFAHGTSVELALQWPAGASVWFFLGQELGTPVSWGSLGLQRLDPFVQLGSSVAGASHVASLPIPIPNDPALAGFIAPLQALATHPTLPPGLRASTLIRVRIL